MIDTMTWIGVAATAVNVVCACIYIWAPRRHHHQFDPWTDWIEDNKTLYSQVRGVRYRTCNTCSKVQEQTAGEHHCLDSEKRKPCSHLKSLLYDPLARIDRLEKDLGL